ncbi:MAG: thioredoxin family protein [Acidimicrobiales bacterium]
MVEATKEDFRDLVATGTVLVDIWGPQCQPCLALGPTVEALAEANAEISVIKLEAPKARRLCMELKVMGLPAFLMFVDGAEVARVADPALSASKLTAWVEATLAGLNQGVNS